MYTYRILLVIFVVHCISGLGISQEAEFNKAVMALNNENYPEAIDLLEEILADSVESKELYCNIGHAYLKNGNVGKSILYLERAAILAPNDKTTNELLAIAKNQVEIKVTKIPDFIVWQWYQKTARLFSSNIWSGIQIGTLGIGIILFGGILLNRLLQWRYKLLCALLLIISGLSYTMASFQRKSIEQSNAAIFMEPRGVIYSGADERSDALADVSEGVKMYILDVIGDWYKVQLDDKDVGWIKKEKVEII